jgi:uncharacterized protein involved in cysteine biosynthesis
MGFSREKVSESMLNTTAQGSIGPRDLRPPAAGPLGFLDGLRAALWGLRILATDARVRRSAAWPLGITLVVYAGFFALSAWGWPQLVGLAWPKPEATWLRVLWYFAVGLLFLASLTAVVWAFTVTSEVIAGPFFDAMVEGLLRTNGIAPHPVGFRDGVVLDLGRTLGFGALSLLLWLMSWVLPPLTPAAVLGTWLALGSGAMNPVLCATGHSTGARIAYVMRRPFSVLGLGAVLGVSALIPLVGIVALPSVVLGGTWLYAREQTNPRLRKADV